MSKLHYVCLIGAFASLHAAAQDDTKKNKSTWTPTLVAQDAPIAKPWEDGATLAITSTDGKTTTIADAVFKISTAPKAKENQGFSQAVFSTGAYFHRNTDSAAPVNDRGLSISYGGMWTDNGSGVGALTWVGWSIDAKAGKKLTSETVDGQKVWFDKNSARVTGAAQYVYQPDVGLLPADRPGQGVFRHFYTAGARLYADRVSGGSGTSGTISGAEIALRADFAPLGLEPTPVGTLGVVPTLAAWAQYQSDFSASGGRERDDRPLYGVKMQLNFASLADASGPGFIPSLALERTTGSDVLTGRAKSGITKLVLSLKY